MLPTKPLRLAPGNFSRSLPMDKPVVAAKAPVAVRLDSNREYYWCACGHSKNQPWCDGSHKGTTLTPLPFRPAESGEKYLCNCKQTANPPWCDGSHKKL
jgi:CDGSH-type Zn-finger protein